MKKRFHFSRGIGAHPNDLADHSPPFHLLSSLYHSPLPCLSLSFLIFSSRNWALNSISWIYSFCTSPFLPNLYLPTSGISLFLEKRKPLESLGKDKCICSSFCCTANTMCLEICTALRLPWLQHCGGRVEVKNQNPCCALACLYMVLRSLLFLADRDTVLIQKSQYEQWRADNVFSLLEREDILLHGAQYSLVK